MADEPEEWNPEGEGPKPVLRKLDDLLKGIKGAVEGSRKGPSSGVDEAVQEATKEIVLKIIKGEPRYQEMLTQYAKEAVEAVFKDWGDPSQSK